MRKRFILLALVFTVIHFALTFYFLTAWSDATKANAPLAGRFTPSLGTGLFTLPFYPLLMDRLPVFGILAINSAFAGIILALILTRLPWIWSLAIIAGVPLFICALAAGAAVLLEQRAEREWRGLNPRPIAHTTTNESARRVDQLLAALRISDRRSLNSFLARELGRGDDLFDPPPQNVAHFLVVQRWELDALEQHLLTSPLPQWSSKGEFLPYYNLQRIILVDALESARSGDQAAAWQRMGAAHRLAASLLQQPTVVAQLIVMASTENQLGVARKLHPAPRFPLQHFDPHQQLIDALAAEAAAAWNLPVPWYVRPYARLCAAEFALESVNDAVTIRNQGGCVFQPAAEKHARSWVPFNPVSAWGDPSTLAVRASRMLLDFEGTEEILTIKGGGRPSPVSRCRDRNWLLDGNVLHLVPPLSSTAPFLPTHHEISLPRPAASVYAAASRRTPDV